MLIKQHTVGTPRCPNHNVPMFRTGDHHKYQCPISGALFDVEVDDTEEGVHHDKFGQAITTYIIKSDGSEKI